MEVLDQILQLPTDLLSEGKGWWVLGFVMVVVVGSFLRCYSRGSAGEFKAKRLAAA